MEKNLAYGWVLLAASVGVAAPLGFVGTLIAYFLPWSGRSLFRAFFLAFPAAVLLTLLYTDLELFGPKSRHLLGCALFVSPGALGGSTLGVALAALVRAVLRRNRILCGGCDTALPENACYCPRCGRRVAG